MSDTENQETQNNLVEAGEPHNALFLVFSHLPLFELLSLSAVCVSLRDAVERDVLQWQLVVDYPLCFRLTDDILNTIARKADGRLTTLALLNCHKITDSGLHEFVEKNPLLTKLYVPGCRRLTPEGVVKAVCQHSHNLKSLMVGDIWGLSNEHLEVLQSHLQKNQPQQLGGLLYHERYIGWKLVNNEFLPMIDVQICPKCNYVKEVYSCSRESCKMIKQDKFLVDCWGCIWCVPKCGNCGGCLKIDEIKKLCVCCGVTMCSSCWLHLSHCNTCIMQPHWDYDSGYDTGYNDWDRDWFSD